MLLLVHVLTMVLWCLLLLLLYVLLLLQRRLLPSELLLRGLLQLDFDLSPLPKLPFSLKQRLSVQLLLLRHLERHLALLQSLLHLLPACLSFQPALLLLAKLLLQLLEILKPAHRHLYHDLRLWRHHPEQGCLAESGTVCKGTDLQRSWKLADGGCLGSGEEPHRSFGLLLHFLILVHGGPCADEWLKHLVWRFYVRLGAC